jgi:hypothetical protein
VEHKVLIGYIRKYIPIFACKASREEDTSWRTGLYEGDNIKNGIRYTICAGVD